MTPDEVREFRDRAQRNVETENARARAARGDLLRTHHENMASYHQGQVDAYDLVLLGMKVSR